MAYNSSSKESVSAGTSHEKDDDDDEDDGKGKKAKAASAALAGIATEKLLKKEDQERKSRTELFWRKITGEAEKSKESEASLLGLDKADDSLIRPDKDAPATTGLEESLTDRVDGTDAETNQTVVDGTYAEYAARDNEQELAESTELKQAAREFAEVRLSEADGQLHELPLDVQATPEAAEAAADVALLRTMQEQLEGDSTQSAGEALEAVQQAMVEHIRNLPTEAAEVATVEGDPGAATQSTEQVQPVSENSGGTADSETDPTERRDPLNTESVETPPVDDITASGSEASAGNFPPIPPVPPSVGRGGRDPYGSYGPGGPPFVPGGWTQSPNLSGGMPAHGAGHEVKSGDTYSSHDMAYAERSGAGRGLIVGGLVGYFFGRRRGKRLGRAESEKRSKPVRRGLEKQVENLQYSITAKERQIKAMAREKMQTVLRKSDRERFVDGILQPVSQHASGREAVSSPLSSRAMAEATGRADAKPNSKPSTAQLYSRESPAATLTSAELLIHDRHRQEAGAVSGNLGRMLVEAPFAGAAAATLRRETAQSINHSAERAPVIPFNKKVEQFTDDELQATAEKIKVQGVSLKEMVQMGSLDERSLRVVVAEFLEGGDVSTVVTREIKERELKFERDPRMRQAAGGGQRSGGTGGGVADATTAGMLAAGGVANSTTGSSASQAGGVVPGNDIGQTGSRPMPDAATLKALRDKQIATVASTTLLVVFAVVAVIMLTR